MDEIKNIVKEIITEMNSVMVKATNEIMRLKTKLDKIRSILEIMDDDKSMALDKIKAIIKGE